MSELSTFINEVGFPVLACLLMYKQQVKITDSITELSNTLKGLDVRIEQMEKGLK